MDIDKKDSPKAGTAQASSEAPLTTFIQLDGAQSIPSHYRTAGTFNILRLQSPVGMADRITKLSPVPALLVSISLKPLPRDGYRVWAGDKLYRTPAVEQFRANVVDFASMPRCWAGSTFDFIHYSIPRVGLDDIAEDSGVGRVREYRPVLLADDMVIAQITKSILPFIGQSDALSMLALDQLGLVFGAHLVQRYGILQTPLRWAKGGLAPWQKRLAAELLHENLHGRIRLAELARECGLSVSHFARSFKISFGASTHQWLMQHRVEHAKELMMRTDISLIDVAIQSGFNDQAAFTRVFRQIIGISPGRWRRELDRPQ